MFSPDSVNPTIWTLAHVVPVHAHQVFEKYKHGLGLVTMERRAANVNNSGKKQSLGTETKRGKDVSFSWAAIVAVSLMLRNRDPAVSALSYKTSILFW